MDSMNEIRKRSLIFVPFGYIEKAETGANIKKNWNVLSLYLKNCCVALASAKHYNPNSDVALVTNIEIPEPFAGILKKEDILVFHENFEEFDFGPGYFQRLSFYYSCGLYRTIKNHPYDYYVCLDSDIYVQASLNPIWEELDQRMLLWDTEHGLQNSSYVAFLKEIHEYTGNDELIPHYGGEFFACKREHGLAFMEQELELFFEMKKKAWRTSFGDEFITSIVASRNKFMVKHAGAYIFRFWTGTFRLVSTRYQVDPVLILHVPAEKNTGMVALYTRYISKGRIPSRKTVWRLLHLSHWGIVNRCKYIVKKILKKQ